MIPRGGCMRPMNCGPPLLYIISSLCRICQHFHIGNGKQQKKTNIVHCEPLSRRGQKHQRTQKLCLPVQSCQRVLITLRSRLQILTTSSSFSLRFLFCKEIKQKLYELHTQLWNALKETCFPAYDKPLQSSKPIAQPSPFSTAMDVNKLEVFHAGN